MDIRMWFSRKSSDCFLPEDDEWPALFNGLHSVAACLKTLEHVLELEQAAQASDGDAFHAVCAHTERRQSCPGRSDSEDADDPGPPDSPEPPAGAPKSLADGVACDVPEPIASGRESPAGRAEPSADGRPRARTAPTADSADEWPDSDRDRDRFVCTAGCLSRTGEPRQFPSEKSRRIHMAARHGQRAGRRYPEYACPLCRCDHKRPSELAQHIASCHGESPLPAAPERDEPDLAMCRLCHVCFPRPDLMRQHACQYAPAGGMVQALISCGALAASGEELNQLRRFICHQCEEEFRNCHMLRVHLQFCHAPPFPCHLCDEVCATGRQLIQHKASQHSELKRPLFPCPAPDCGLSFLRHASYQKHLLKQHGARGPATPYGCDCCDKKFIRKIYLTHHKLRYHHDRLQRDFVCDVCGARLGSSSALNVHVVSVHQKPEFTCDVCGKVFSRQDRLKNHSKIHTGEKPYKCLLCPKAFIQQCKLNDHMRRHRGEKRFRCVVCDKLYAASHDLRAHLRRVHSVDMVNRTHTIQPVSSLLRPLPPPEPQPPPEPEPEPLRQPEPPVEQVTLPVQQPVQGVQLHSVQVAAPAQTLHVQELTQLTRSVILIPAVDPSGATSFYPILNT